MTHTDAEFIAAILAHPDEDTPRLVYADWLDEQPQEREACQNCSDGSLLLGHWCASCDGTGTIISTANRDRAEFIRVQVEIARLRSLATDPRDDIGSGWSIPVPERHQYNEHVFRADTLLAANEAAWRAGPVCEDCNGTGIYQEEGPVHGDRCVKCFGTGDAGGLLRIFDYGTTPLRRQNTVRIDWTRFPALRVSVPRLSDCVEEVLDEDCRTCSTTAGHGHRPHCSAVRKMRWQPTDWLTAVVTHHPEVVEVVPLDREPEQWVNGFAWYKDGQPWSPRPHMELPTILFDLLEGGQLEISGMTKKYNTRELAVTALARVIVQFGRKGNHILGSSGHRENNSRISPQCS